MKRGVISVQKLLCVFTITRTNPLLQLDLAASLVKVADVSGALGDAATQDELTAEARRLADGVDEAALNKAGAAKLGGLRTYFALQQQAA